MKKSHYKTALIFTAALVAALATYPYGYRFANFFNIQNTILLIITGALLGGINTAANMGLGSYSLFEIDLKNSKHNPLYVLTLSLLGSVPAGFQCFFGYKDTLPLIINITLSIITVIVNTGIGYTAINSLLDNFTNLKSNKVSVAGKSIGFVLGLCASTTSYLATAHGLTILLLDFDVSDTAAQNLGNYFAIIAWLPYAALYSNGTLQAGEQIANFLSHFKKQITKIGWKNIALLVFALLSGTAFAQMTVEFFNPQNQIPLWFKSSAIQILVLPTLMPLALICSAAVNYFALSTLIKKFFK